MNAFLKKIYFGDEMKYLSMSQKSRTFFEMTVDF